jgi:Na+-driven multidrug efflux pump
MRSQAAAIDSSRTHQNIRILRTFFHYLIPSVIGLLSLSTASVVDGLLVAHFLGPAALAAVNLLIPVLTFYFGVGLMLAVGASVRATFDLERQGHADASMIFSNTLLLVAVLAFSAMVAAYFLQSVLFSLLGAPPELHLLLRQYFQVLLLGWLPQLLAVTFYYFVRALGHPRAATGALICGAMVNIVLDGLFLGIFRWDLASAAWATVIAQTIQCLVLWTWFLRLPHGLRWRPRWRGLKIVGRASANGFSEFINEISAGVVLGVLHSQLLRQSGADALAGFSLVNYSLFIHLMIGCAIAEVVYTLVSRHTGRGDFVGARSFFHAGLLSALSIAGMYTLVLLIFGPLWMRAIFPQAAGDYSHAYLLWIWPAFIACACNLVLGARFTGLQNARISLSIALLRSLFLPLALLVLVDWARLGVPAVAAIPAAEWMTLAMAIWWWRANSKCHMRQMQQM